MADINSFQDAGSYNIQTQPGPGFTTPGSGGADMAAFFDLAAKRKAQAAAEEKRRYERDFAMKHQSFEDQRRAQQQAANEHGQDRHLAELQRNAAPRVEYADVPAMKQLAFGVNSATTRVAQNSQAADSNDFGVRGY